MIIRHVPALSWSMLVLMVIISKGRCKQSPPAPSAAESINNDDSSPNSKFQPAQPPVLVLTPEGGQTTDYHQSFQPPNQTRLPTGLSTNIVEHQQLITTTRGAGKNNDSSRFHPHSAAAQEDSSQRPLPSTSSNDGLRKRQPPGYSQPQPPKMHQFGFDTAGEHMVTMIGNVGGEEQRSIGEKKDELQRVAVVQRLRQQHQQLAARRIAAWKKIYGQIPNQLPTKRATRDQQQQQQQMIRLRMMEEERENHRQKERKGDEDEEADIRTMGGGHNAFAVSGVQKAHFKSFKGSSNAIKHEDEQRRQQQLQVGGVDETGITFLHREPIGRIPIAFMEDSNLGRSANIEQKMMKARSKEDETGPSAFTSSNFARGQEKDKHFIPPELQIDAERRMSLTEKNRRIRRKDLSYKTLPADNPLLWKSNNQPPAYDGNSFIGSPLRYQVGGGIPKGTYGGGKSVDNWKGDKHGGVAYSPAAEASSYHKHPKQLSGYSSSSAVNNETPDDGYAPTNKRYGGRNKYGDRQTSAADASNLLMEFARKTPIGRHYYGLDYGTPSVENNNHPTYGGGSVENYSSASETVSSSAGYGNTVSPVKTDNSRYQPSSIYQQQQRPEPVEGGYGQRRRPSGYSLGSPSGGYGAPPAKRPPPNYHQKTPLSSAQQQTKISSPGGYQTTNPYHLYSREKTPLTHRKVLAGYGSDMEASEKTGWRMVASKGYVTNKGWGAVEVPIMHGKGSEGGAYGQPQGGSSDNSPKAYGFVGSFHKQYGSSAAMLHHQVNPPDKTQDPCFWKYSNTVVGNAQPFERRSMNDQGDPITLQECREDCFRTRCPNCRFQCVSLIFDSTNQVCDLFAHSGRVYPAALLVFHGRDYYEYTGSNTCDESISPTTKRPTTTFRTRKPTTPNSSFSTTTPTTTSTNELGICKDISGTQPKLSRATNFKISESSANPIGELTEVSVQECIDFCREFEQEPCESLVYDDRSESCKLYGLGVSDSSETRKVEASGSFIYRFTCIDDAQVDECQLRSDPDVFFDWYPQRLLVGYSNVVESRESVSDCKQFCVESGSDCRSMMFFYQIKDSNCITNVETRSSQPLLFNEEPRSRDIVDYFDNRCQQQDTFGTRSVLSSRRFGRSGSGRRTGQLRNGRTALLFSRDGQKKRAFKSLVSRLTSKFRKFQFRDQNRRVMLHTLRDATAGEAERKESLSVTNTRHGHKRVTSAEWSEWTPCDRKYNGRRIRFQLCNETDLSECPMETEKCLNDQEWKKKKKKEKKVISLSAGIK